MLNRLTIDRVAVIDHAEVTFDRGLTVLTGETGAGKSILIDALSAVLGERVSRNLVRGGSRDAVIAAQFSDIPKAAAEYLQTMGYDSQEDGTLLLRRRISAENKSACYIGGIPCTAGVLRDLGRMLVNIHGQHENQALLSRDRHAGYLDALGGYDQVLSQYRECYRRYCDTHRKLHKLQREEKEKEQRRDVLSFQIEELSSAQLTLGEEKRIFAQRTLLRNAEKVEQLLHGALQNMDGDDEHPGALTELEQAVADLSEAGQMHNGAKLLSDQMETTLYDIQEQVKTLRALTEDPDMDLTQLDAVEERADIVHRLCGKYGGSTESALAYLQQAKRELRQIQQDDEEISRLSELLGQQRDSLLSAGKALTEARRGAADLFCQKVGEQLSYLDMPQVTLEVSIQPAPFTSGGADQVEFLISANPGEPPKPMAKIASGGELSRVMLALKSVLTTADEIPTLIFDEIDTGISGRAADKVGNRLRALAVGTGKQVLCITHLPQIAAYAHHHLLVEKQVHDGRTFTQVRALDDQSRPQALARLIGGQATQSAVDTAREMLERGAKD